MNKIPEQNNPKATATTNVTNGKSKTNNIVFNEQFIPGTYIIKAEYQENNNYENSTNTGTLTIYQPHNITDNCTTLTKWKSTPEAPTASSVTEDEYSCISGGVTSTGSNYWNIPLYLYDVWVLSFKVKIGGNYGLVGLTRLSTHNNNYNDIIMQCPLAWNGWGVGEVGQANMMPNTQMNQNTWYDIKLENHNSKITLYIDGVESGTVSIPPHQDNIFNYLFFCINEIYNENEVFVTDILLKTNNVYTGALSDIILDDGEDNPSMIALPTGIENNWTVIPHATQTTSPNIWNDDYTMNMGQRQQNLYPIPSREEGTQYNVYIYTATNFRIGVVNTDGTTISNNNSNYIDSYFGTVPKDSINRFSLSFEEDGIYLSYDDTSILLTASLARSYIFLYTGASTRTDKILAITQDNGGGQ